MSPDLVVIGGGAAGLSAARTARRRHASVTLVSDGPLGGDCTFSGCVPSKTLLSSARGGRSFDDAMADVRRVVAEIASREDDDVLTREGVRVVRGRATFVNATVVRVGSATLRGARVVIATGASPLIPSIPGIDDVPVVTNESLFAMTSLPTRLVILGAGPIGVEMAEAFARLGSAVTLVEASSRVLPREEAEASAVIGAYLAGLGVTVLTATSVTAVSNADHHIVVTDDRGGSLTADAVLVAVGRRPTTDDLGLEAARVGVDERGFVTVESTMRTTQRHLFAAGDVALAQQFTHVADETGRIAATNALSRVARRRFHPEWTPMVTYTGLEVARVGVTESEAGPGARVAYLPMTELDRAVTSGEDQGFVKIIVEPRPLTRNAAGGAIVGATIVAPRAGDMLQEIVLAMRARMWPARLATTTHPYPSWALAVQQTASQFFGVFGGRTARVAQRDGES